jgi:hypothetical protein
MNLRQTRQGLHREAERHELFGRATRHNPDLFLTSLVFSLWAIALFYVANA